MKKNKAVFLDRDGVIIEEVDYLRHEKDLRLLPGAAAALVLLRQAGFKLIVITNQSGVARGYLTLAKLSRIHRKLQAALRRLGARLDAIYFCPHHPEAGRRVHCSCRKPGIALLKKAAKRFSVDFSRSYFVGDTTTDVLAARNAGCKSVLVKTGYGGKDGVHSVKPDASARDLAAAARLILREASRETARKKIRKSNKSKRTP